MHLKYKTILDNAGINTPLRLAHFMGQLEHESGLKPVSENLNYSVDGLQKVFKHYFPDYATALKYARNPAKIANKVYSNRMGNCDEQSGDGWKYRGRGFIQITGKDNYTRLSKYTGTDYVSNPDLLLNEADAMISAIWYWTIIKANAMADKDNLIGITKAINGGKNGLEDRLQKVNKWKLKLGIK